MAAYGALVSVMQIIDQLHRHPHPPISLHKQHVESLTANLTFLQEFLEAYNPRRNYTSEADPLESRIAEAAYAAEDVIENYIVDQIRARSTDDGGNISSSEFYQGLEKVIQEMDLIKMEIVEKKMEGVQIIKKQSTIADAADSSRSSSTAQKVTTMVGLDDALYEVGLYKITRGVRARLIIPIVGMGGLGSVQFEFNERSGHESAFSKATIRRILLPEQWDGDLYKGSSKKELKDKLKAILDSSSSDDEDYQPMSQDSQDPDDFMDEPLGSIHLKD